MPEIEPAAKPRDYKPSESAAIEEILRLKHPWMILTQGLFDIARAMKTDTAVTPELQVIQAQRENLLALEPEALYQLLVEERAKDERARFYNVRISPVEIAQWARLDAWTPEEAVALLLGRNPERVNWTKIKWRLQESPFVQLYQRLLLIVQRATPLQTGERLNPATVLSWGPVQHGLTPPEELVELVQARQQRFLVTSEPASIKSSPAANAPSSTPTRWTDEMKEELRAYRKKHGLAAAAKKYKITPQRISQVLSKDRLHANSSVFTMGKPRPK